MKLFLAACLVSVIAYAYQGLPQVIVTQTETNGTATSTEVLDANGQRSYLSMQNKGDVDCYVKFGSAHTSSEGVKVTSGSTYQPVAVPTAAVYYKCNSGSHKVNIVEGTAQ